MTKECSTWAGQAGDVCTITSSNLKAIEVGSRVVYAQAADFRAALPRWTATSSSTLLGPATTRPSATAT